MMSDDENEDIGFGADDFGEDVVFEDFETGSKEGGIGELIRTNPLAKIGVVVGGLFVVVAAIILFGGEEQTSPRSSVEGGSEVTGIPGRDEVSPEYREAVEEINQRTAEEAVKTGGSALPVPISPPVGVVELGQDDTPEEDPLERWRRIQEERQRREQAPPEVEETDPYAETVSSLAAAMASQMQTILDTTAIEELSLLEVADDQWLEEKREKEREKAEKEREEAEKDKTGEDGIINIIVPAGTIEYGQLLTEANSDAEAPILAQVVSGPLAGSRMIGSFKVEEEFLVLEFQTIVIDGISHSINALAINPETTTPAMVTDINHRYFRRVILPAAAAFVEGLGGAIAQTGSTTVSTDSGGTTATQQENLDTREEIFKALEESAGKVSEILDENADVEPLVRVEPGTPLGIMFLEPVTDEGSGGGRSGRSQL